MSETQPESLPKQRLVAHPLGLKEEAYTIYAKHNGQDCLGEIATTLNIPRDTVAMWSSRGKWRQRLIATRKQPSVSAAQTASSGKSTSEAQDVGKLSFEEKQTSYKNAMADTALRIADEIATLEGPQLLVSADRIKKLDDVARKALDLETSKAQTIVNLQFLRGLTGQDNTVERIANAHEVVHSLPTSEPAT